jgi:ABC-type transport system involved in multi-copper enzyme maturation permease subunit
MTTATTAQPQPAPVTGTPVSQGRVVLSEWIKFRSLRSTVWTLAVSVLIIVGLGLLFAAVSGAHQQHNGVQSGPDPVTLTLSGAFLAQLVVGVLGVLLITGEYSTGMIRATLAAVPRRLPVLWAKLAVFAVVAFVISAIAAVIAFLCGQAILSSDHVQSASLTDPGALRAVIGAALYLTVVGLLGMGLGCIIRNTAGTITSLFGVLLVLPILGAVLPTNWSNDISPYLPSNAGQAVMHLTRGTNTLAPWTGFGLFVGYAAVVIAVGAVMLRRRDA